MKELELYKMYVTEPLEDGNMTNSLQYGFMTSKPISGEDLLAINQYYSNKKLDSNSLNLTLFTADELKDVSLMNKVYKQLLHYISGGDFGTQTFEVSGKKVTFDLVQIVTKEELFEAIKSDLYTSKPLSEDKIKGIVELINDFGFEIDFKQVKNNEFKSLFLVNSNDYIFGVSGDDVMRAIVKIATDSTLLIKSKSVIDSLVLNSYKKEILSLLSRYVTELSQVFNRHKRLILALKTEENKAVINRIGKLSKSNHIPIKQSLNKVFMSKYLKMDENSIVSNLPSDLKKLTVVDKMKLINLSDISLSGMKDRVFIIRNGKAHIQEDGNNVSQLRVTYIRSQLMKSLADDLSFLKDKNIKYPENIDYGFPISEKKSAGHIPFGTVINATGKNDYLVAGMYWRNSWGSHDLDLSSIGIDGSRTGWGQISSYAKGVLFSGDITNAPNGAIEYLANNGESPVVLINNIFSGNFGTKFKIVIGEQDSISSRGSNKYVENVLAEIDCSFKSQCKHMTLGALWQDKFVIYPLSLGNQSVSTKKDKAILPYMLVEYTRLKEVLELSGATLNDDSRDFDIDLSIENVTFDKLIKVITKDNIDNKINI